MNIYGLPMDRKIFLGRAGLAIGGFVLGRHMPIHGEERLATEGVIRDSVLKPVADYKLYASGGLCAPLAPIYDMPVFGAPVRDALPAFTAKRGGITYPG